jgi:hypothetical protein
MWERSSGEREFIAEVMIVVVGGGGGTGSGSGV